MIDEVRQQVRLGAPHLSGVPVLGRQPGEQHSHPPWRNGRVQGVDAVRSHESGLYVGVELGAAGS